MWNLTQSPLLNFRTRGPGISTGMRGAFSRSSIQVVRTLRIFLMRAIPMMSTLMDHSVRVPRYPAEPCLTHDGRTLQEARQRAHTSCFMTFGLSR